MINHSPESLGYKIGMNIAPFINKCINEYGECFISEGEHVFGRNDKDYHLGYVWSDSCITWGWNKKHNVKIVGCGKNKTILKLISDCNSRYINNLEKDIVFMLQTNYNESCDNNIIENITFDGNYEENKETSTICAIRIRGANNTVKNCSFINFGVGGNQKHECFQVGIGPINNYEKGPNILNNTFSSVGNKSKSFTGYVPENTLLAVGGVDVLIENNLFEDIVFDPKTQQSPVHGITLGNSHQATIKHNVFKRFDGSCIYMDSWKNSQTLIENNVCEDIHSFIQLSCQFWSNKDQISFNRNFLVQNNKITLSKKPCYYQWDKPPFASYFIGYLRDPSLNRSLYPGFQDIVVTNNIVELGHFQNEKSAELKCFWGEPATKEEILLTDNVFTSTVKDTKIKWYTKLLNFFKNLFR